MTPVETVRGAVDGAELGMTLMHEHVVNLNAELARDQPELSWGPDRQAVLDRVVTTLSHVKAAGIDTIVDATALGHGRDVEFVREVNTRVELNIVVATGIYTFDAVPFYVHHRAPSHAEPRDVLTELFVRDITDGVAETGVKAGIIKCATDAPGVTPTIDRILRCVATAHRETGAPITTHTLAVDRNGLDQQTVFAAEGVDLSRVIIGHSGDSADIDYLRALMDAGSTIGADRFGMYLPGRPTLEERSATVATLCSLGYADRIVLSHDHTCYTDWFAPGAFPHPAEWHPTHISDRVVPHLRELGVEDNDLSQMLIENPRRLLTTRSPY